MRWWRRKDREQDLQRELGSHLELEAEEQQDQGLSHDDARYAARRALGNLTRVKEETRATWGWSSWERLLQDVRYALRTMLANKAFTATAILTLALGIGANTAIFSIVRAVLLKPLEYHDPDRLVLVSGGATLAHVDVLRQGRSFEDLGIHMVGTENMTLGGGVEPEMLKGVRVSANFLKILGVEPLLGRSFLPEEDVPGGRPVVMISNGLWKRRFGGDPSIVGRTVALAATPHTIVGVLPAGLQFPFPDLDVWATKPTEMATLSPKSRELSPVLSVFGRLKPGVDIKQATAEVSVLNRQYAAVHPTMLDAKPNAITVVKPFKESLVASVQSKLWMLFGAVGFVLLIACANVASLLLARAGSRAREFAVRVAIGAGRGRLIRQLLTESVLLALAGGVLGVLLAKWSLRGIAGMTTVELPRAGEVRLDGWVLLFSIALSIATGVLFGLVPSLVASRPDVAGMLRGSIDGVPGRVSRWWSARGLFVILQVGLSTVLLIGATLLIESVARLDSVLPGFQPANVLTMQIALPPTRYDTKQKRASFFNELVEATGSIPEVESAGGTFMLPLTGWVGSPVQIAERAPVKFNERPIAVIDSVTPGYLRTLQIALRAGREFTTRDTTDAQAVAIVNETLVRRFWPEYPHGQSPIGQHIFVGLNPQAAEIVGVMADVRESGLDEDPRPCVFVPMSQSPLSAGMFAVRTKPGGDPLRVAHAVRSKVTEIDRDQPIASLKTMDEIVGASIGQRRFLMRLLGLFAATALVLAVLGIYGVIAYSVVQRTKELGIRRALGAQRSDILSLVVGQGLGLAVVGVVFGIGGALALTRVMVSVLFHVSATDPLTFIGVAVVFVLVALAASIVPALRAARIDPMTALRVG